MVQFRPVLFVLGLMLSVIAGAMLVPAVVDVADTNDDWRSFFLSAILTFYFGGLLMLVTYDERPFRLGIKEGFLLTTLCWIVICGFAALPFIGIGLSYTDAYFEAMSGLTTTGSTVIEGLDKLPRGMLLWRALLNWIGGLGIVVVAIIMLPFLRVGGMQLFQTESSDKSEKIVPRALELMTATAGVYLALSMLCALLYALFGMTPFDAICHAMATLATGGFSTHDESFGFFRKPEFNFRAIEWTGVVFMIAGAMPFVVFIKSVRGDPGALWRDQQVRSFLLLLFVVSVMLALWLVRTKGLGFLEALRTAAFNVTSIVTTTGFASEDYTAWGALSFGLFFLLTFIGGCSGSTAGAIKIYRLQVAGLFARSHFLHLVSPSRIVRLTYNGRRLPEDVPFSVVAFLAIYMTSVGIIALALSALGLDFVTAISSAAQALGNVGPGLGEVVGPAGNFKRLPDEAKWILSFAMMLGRLELFTVLVLLMPSFWRH